MSEKKEISKPILIICVAVLIVMSYFLGNSDGTNNGKIELCEEMGGFLGMNKITKEIECYNGTIIDIPLEPTFGGNITWE